MNNRITAIRNCIVRNPHYRRELREWLHSVTPSLSDREPKLLNGIVTPATESELEYVYMDEEPWI